MMTPGYGGMSPFSAVGTISRSRRGRAVLASICALAGVGLGAILSVALRPAGPTTSVSTGGAVAAPRLARQPAAPFILEDQNGAAVSLAAQRGHVVLLTFMDPICSQVCPVMGRDIAAVEQKLPKALDPRLLIVSVAPGRTNSDVQKFLASNLSTPWSAGWHWLLGPDDASLRLAWLHWHVTVQPTAADINHDSILNVIDREGYLRVSFPAPLLVSDVVSAITEIART
jgi:cytochrome oxidase Cu insertion factor (SCO1/SenC/PrrC family)